MDRTCLISVTSHVTAFTCSLIALVHARQRSVPPLVAKFRALVLVHSCVNTAWTASRGHLLAAGDAHTNTTTGVAILAFSSRAFLWVEFLYFLEFVASVLIKFDTEVSSRASRFFDKNRACWRVARLLTIVAFASLMIVFPAHPDNLAKMLMHLYSSILAVLVLLPLTYATARNAYEIRVHCRKVKSGTETSQTKALRSAEYQLFFFSLFIAHFFVLYAYYISINLPDLIATLHAPWVVDECHVGWNFAFDDPLILALILTKSTGSPPRHTNQARSYRKSYECKRRNLTSTTNTPPLPVFTLSSLDSVSGDDDLDAATYTAKDTRLSVVLDNSYDED